MVKPRANKEKRSVRYARAAAHAKATHTDDCCCTYAPATGNSYATFLLRIVLGGVFLWLGVTQVLNIPYTTAHFVLLGLWGWVGPIIAAAEVAGGAVLFLGYWTRSVSFAIAVLCMLTLILFAARDGFTRELIAPLVGLGSAVILATNGPGLWALDNPTCTCEGDCRW